MKSKEASVWVLVPPEPWEENESGLVFANKADMAKGVKPRLVGDWGSGSEGLPTNKWVPYSDVLLGGTVNDEDNEELYADEICIVNQIGSQKRIPIPPGIATHVYARGAGIYRHSERLVFVNASPHTWCGIDNTSVTTVDLRKFSVTIQRLGERGFICDYLENLLEDTEGADVYSWSNSDVEMCLSNRGNTLLFSAERPALTLEMTWTDGTWVIRGYKEGWCTPRNESFYLFDMKNRLSY